MKDGFEAWEIPHEAWEMQSLDSLGRRIYPGQEQSIPATVKDLLSRHEDLAGRIEAIRNQNVVNFGSAGEPIAEALIHLAQSLQAEKKSK